MEYCEWLDGDVCAYRDAGVYRAHVAEGALADGLCDEYVEPSAAALLARMLWLRVKGCDYPVAALDLLVKDVVAELDGQEEG